MYVGLVEGGRGGERGEGNLDNDGNVKKTYIYTFSPPNNFLCLTSITMLKGEIHYF